MTKVLTQVIPSDTAKRNHAKIRLAAKILARLPEPDSDGNFSSVTDAQIPWVLAMSCGRNEFIRLTDIERSGSVREITMNHAYKLAEYSPDILSAVMCAKLNETYITLSDSVLNKAKARQLSESVEEAMP